MSERLQRSIGCCPLFYCKWVSTEQLYCQDEYMYLHTGWSSVIIPIFDLLHLTLPSRKAEKPASPTVTNSRKAEIPASRSLIYSRKDEISA